ncbi:MAG: HD domain-containing protein [Gemmatimonadetes bacterium]|nr:HD domain-containing protein [Gemmatimonadota bacterium]
MTSNVEKKGGTDRFRDRVLITVPVRGNSKLEAAIESVNRDDDLYGLWTAANVTAIDRLGMTDHGPVHVKIVMNIAVRMLRLLIEADVRPAVVEDYGMGNDDAEVVVALAALFHDVGMSIHRVDHESFSLFIADRKLRELLPDLYDGPTATVIRSEILHAIIGHRSGGSPLTLEAGVVRIADALDMAQGRSRIPFEAGSTSIHSVSAAAIDKVSIERGEAKPVRIVIDMSNSAGVFQLDQLFRSKLQGSGIERYVEVRGKLDGETEKSLVREYSL